jgi:hypothetical protein
MERSSRLQKMREALKRTVVRVCGGRPIAMTAGTTESDRAYARRIAAKQDLAALRKRK